MNQVRAVQFAEDGEDAAGVVDILDVHIGGGRSDLRQMRHMARKPVDVGHREGHLALLRRSQQM